MSAGERRATRLGAALTALVACALLAPRLVTPGEYVDGLVYATIARNLAIGVGSVWHPFYTPTLHADFHEHPPLGLVLESWSFRALGDHAWTEKAHALALTLAAAALVVALWRAFAGRSGRGLAWLPLAVWAAMPLSAWMVVNAMLEDGITLTALAAVACLVAAERARDAQPRRRTAAWLAWHGAAAVALAAGFWIKGPLALFPLAWPALIGAAAALPPARRRAALVQGVVGSAALAAVVAALIAATLLHRDAAQSMHQYWEQQLGPSLSGRRAGHEGARLRMLSGLWDQLRVALGLVALLLIVPTTRRRMLRGLRDRAALACLALGLGAALPLLATSRFAPHYLGPALPFLALAGALACRRPLRALVAACARVPDAVARAAPAVTAAMVVALIAVLVARRDAIMRDAELNRAVAALRGVGPVFGEIVGAAPAFAEDWRTQGYHARFLGLGLDAGPTGVARAFWLGRTGDDPPSGFTPITPPLADGSRLFARR